jgi:hypothetical protein
MAVRKEPKIIFDRLLTRLLEGMVVPFIGAGVSFEAKHEEGIKDLTRTCKMLNRVLEALKERCSNKDECGPCVVKNELCKERNMDSNKISFDKVCELWEWSCSETHQVRRCELIYDILQIPEFTKLEPTDAHYYISFLAREGLIDEIITTNYDTCMEKAYCNTFELKYPEENSPALVIDNLSEYRNKAGKRFTERQMSQRCLKIYKINGCAGKLPTKQRHDKNGCCKCKDILLTERDLQDWRHRGWARDLFRDRMRSRTLLFSGFGSEEPQVRFTAMQVCEEFTLQKEEDIQLCTDNSGNIWTKPNAPFIVGYGNNLTFSQTQILHAFAHSSNTSISLKDLNSNFFLDSDIEFFNSKDDSSKQINADLFWKRLFQAAFWRLLRKECIRDGAAASFFTRTLPCANTLMIEVLNWFAPENDTNFVFGRFPEMLDLKESEGRVIPLMRWIERVCVFQTKVREGLYIPVGKSSVLIMVILMLIYLLLLKDVSSEPKNDITWSLLNDVIIKNKDKNSHLGLYLDTSYISNSDNTGLYIIHRDAASCLPKKIPWREDNKNNTVIQIVVGDWQASTRRVWIVNEKTNDVKAVTVRQLSFLQLLGQAHNVKEVKKAFRDNLRRTFQLTDEGRRHVRLRTEPL